VGVRLNRRGEGLGHALVAACLRQCRRRRLEAAELDVDETNAVAMHVYDDCGFEPLFRILWYRLDLQDTR
jgi:ribosomal protein S18 acetylase RimI-like enzyme